MSVTHPVDLQPVQLQRPLDPLPLVLRMRQRRPAVTSRDESSVLTWPDHDPDRADGYTVGLEEFGEALLVETVGEAFDL